MIDFYEIVAVIEAQRDSDGNVVSYDYAIVEFVATDSGPENENRLMSGSADDFETAERNVREKLVNLDRPAI